LQGAEAATVAATRARAFAAATLAAALLTAGCAGSGGGGGGPSPASIDPNARPEELLALADSAIAAGEPELARHALARASDLASTSAAVHCGYGRYYTAVYRYKDAKTEFERAAAIDPLSAEPHYGLGLAYLKAGSKDQAFRELSAALKLEPSHAGTLAAIRPLLEDRYRAAGVPPEYAAIPGQPSVSRGELGVMLAVELGVDPDRATWRADQAFRTDWPTIDAAWGSRWLRASVARGWIAPLADGSLHLDDPVTRGALAILMSRVYSPSKIMVRPDTLGAMGMSSREFSDLGRHHYLWQAAVSATQMGLPTRDGGAFEAQSFATGWETLGALRGLARSTAAVPIVSAEPGPPPLVK
ncbi:MAG: tetratricopeptide repeat protein, partial [Candidatus Eiseniibacteriota bacterium]